MGILNLTIQLGYPVIFFFYTCISVLRNFIKNISDKLTSVKIAHEIRLPFYASTSVLSEANSFRYRSIYDREIGAIRETSGEQLRISTIHLDRRLPARGWSIRDSFEKKNEV